MTKIIGDIIIARNAVPSMATIRGGPEVWREIWIADGYSGVYQSNYHSFCADGILPSGGKIEVLWTPLITVTDIIREGKINSNADGVQRRA